MNGFDKTVDAQADQAFAVYIWYKDFFSNIVQIF